MEECMNLERRVADLNKYFFFDEFTYSNNKFKPTPNIEVELADNIIWIGNILIIFQLKERNIDNQTDVENESKWFSKKVLTKAGQQIRDSINYLHENTSIEIENHRGHVFNIDLSKIEHIHNVICYLPHEKLSEKERKIKFKVSEKSGFIHIFAYEDYQGVVRTLLTLTEVSEYLQFRQEKLEKCDSINLEIAEQALIGQFINGDFDAPMSNNFYYDFLSLDHKLEEWDMSRIISSFSEKITTSNHYTDYYKIVSEIAQLKRSELREFKKRFELSMKNCGGEEYILPYRMQCLKTGCGFVFIPINEQAEKVRQIVLQNLTYGCKYDLHAEKCIGISFYPDGAGWYFVEWCYMSFTWEYDKDMSERLQNSSPFRQTELKSVNRYHTHGD